MNWNTFLKFNIWIAILFLSGVFGCSNNKNISFDISRKKIFKQEIKFVKEYGLYPNILNDTVRRDGYTCVYKGGKLFAIGKQRKEIRVEYWYFFNNSLELDYLVSYRKEKPDTLSDPHSMVNRKW